MVELCVYVDYAQLMAPNRKLKIIVTEFVFYTKREKQVSWKVGLDFLFETVRKIPPG